MLSVNCTSHKTKIRQQIVTLVSIILLFLPYSVVGRRYLNLNYKRVVGQYVKLWSLNQLVTIRYGTAQTNIVLLEDNYINLDLINQSNCVCWILTHIRHSLQTSYPITYEFSRTEICHPPALCPSSDSHRIPSASLHRASLKWRRWLHRISPMVTDYEKKSWLNKCPLP